MVLNRVFKLFRRASEASDEASTGLRATVIPREQHGISRQQLSPNAVKVLYRLHRAGYQAYLVGGGVRDLLLGHSPKDFDIVTDARPEQVKKLFHNCRLIGRRFRLAHIMFGREIIEVATMRGHHDDSKASHISKKDDQSGMILRDNVYGTIEEDAERRDFTVNAIYYNIADYSLLDFAGGLDAIQNRRIEMIGDPDARYREDPVRMLRAVRFATKLNMTIAPATEQPIRDLAHLLAGIPAARLFDEVCKLMLAGQAEANLELLRKQGLFEVLFPDLAAYLTDEGTADDINFIRSALRNTDARVNQDQSVTPAFLFASLLWPLVEYKMQELMQQSDLQETEALQVAASEVLDRQQQRTAIPKRFSLVSRDIWSLQIRLPKRQGRKAERLASHPKIRAGFDFLQLRAEIYGNELPALAQWWQDYLPAGHQQRNVLEKQLPKSPQRRRRRRKPSKAQTEHAAQPHD